MPEEIKTMVIPVDEYIELKGRAELNTYFMDRINQFSIELYDVRKMYEELDRRIFELERK